MPSRLTFDTVSLTYPGRSKAAPDVHVLERINLSITSGEFVVVIGRSGSGEDEPPQSGSRFPSSDIGYYFARRKADIRPRSGESCRLSRRRTLSVAECPG